MRTSGFLAVCWLTPWLAVTSAARAEQGLRLPNFNPFAQQHEQRDTGVETQFTDETRGDSLPRLRLPAPPALPKPALPSMPKLQLPKWNWMPNANQRRPRQGPSTWEQINRGTRSFFTKTKATLMPWAEDEKRPARPSVTGARPSTPKTKRRADTPQNVFGSWFDSKPREKEIRTVQDYLSQPRPGTN